MNLGIVSMFVVQFPIAFLLSRKIGVDGIWWAYAITSLVMAIITLCIFARGKWKEKNITGNTLQSVEEKQIEEKIIEETIIAEGK